MAAEKSRRPIWSFAAFLVLVIPFMGMVPWPLLAHAHAILMWFVTILLCVDFVIHRGSEKQELNYLWFLPVIFILYGLLSTTLLSGNWKFVFFGFQNLYLGTWILTCCILIALLLSRRIKLTHLSNFYWSMVLLVPLSVLVNATQLVSNERLYGLVLQPDILAILLGAGLIAGLFVSLNVKQQYILASYTILVSGILLTRTRAVIYLLPFWVICIFLKHRSKLKLIDRKIWLSIGLAFVVVGAATYYAAPRVLSLSRAEYAVSYRADLVRHSSNYLSVMPPWGLGPGGLNTVITDYYKLPQSIEHTIVIDQKVPENSHNLLLDRFLEYGWLTGIAYIVLLTVVTWAAFGARKNKLVQFYAVAGSYLLVQQLVTSTSSLLELLTWICLMGILIQSAKAGRPPRKRILLIGLLILIYLGILGLLVQIRLDTHAAQTRLANGFVFPLATTKSSIEAGTSFNNQTLVWESAAFESYHHNYMAADIHVEEGTGVLAAKGGEVVNVRNFDSCDLRHFPGVTIRGVDGFYYYYTHLKPGTIKVSVGDNLETGESFAQVGSAACAQNTAPHLHLDISRFQNAIRRGPGNSSRFSLIDPQEVLIKAYQELPNK